jgi:hypothetical protein
MRRMQGTALTLETPPFHSETTCEVQLAVARDKAAGV